MNFIDTGINWLNSKVDANLVEPVLVISASGSRKVNATVIEPESRTNSDGVRVHSDTFTFLFNVSDNLDLRAGVKLRRTSKSSRRDFQIVLQDKNKEDYNDPNMTKVAVPARLCS